METIINYAIGILGLVLAYYFYKKSIRAKKPVYSIKSNNLISGSVSTLENLNVTYRDYRVENLTVSKILFYNHGAETVTGQDLDTINHLSISSETCKILDGSVLQANNASNNFKVRYDTANENLFIDFDYLNQNQGAVIQVIHTGLSSETLDVYGDIIGVQKLSHVSPRLFLNKRTIPFSQKVILVSTILLALVYWYLIILANDAVALVLGLKDSILSGVMVALMIGGMMASVSLILLAMLYMGVRLFGEGYFLPEGLEKFNE